MSSSTIPATQAVLTPFHDLDDFIALPRLSGLAISADGRRLVTTVATLSPDRTRYVTALWQVDPSGERPARRLTRSVKGESMPAFMPDGSLLFASARPDPDETDPPDDAPPALLLLPQDGGEARVVATRSGGFDAIAVAAGSGTVIAVSPTLPGSGNGEDDAARRTVRKDLKVQAVLHHTYPVRYWDHDLGPDQGRLLIADDLGSDDGAAADVGATTGAGASARANLRDLTPDAGRALDDAEVAVAPDGSVAVTTWFVPDVGGRRAALHAIDLADGTLRTLIDDPEREAYGPAVSPDSRLVAAVTETRSTAEAPPRFGLVVIDLASGEARNLSTSITAPASTPVWTPDGHALIVTADEHGRRPVFRVDVADGTTTKLTSDDAAYTDVVIAPDGSRAYAVRAPVDGLPTVVALDASAPDQTPTTLPAPIPAVTLPGRLTEVLATAVDGTALRAWLCLPDDATRDAPAPLLLWIHGGPLASHNAWSWRWNPWLAVAQGYAVLLPDPALSTGYGEAFISRGWGRWGAEPYTDLMTMTDAALDRADLDASRSAALGGSFGGYMANWVAGHTDRFAAIVTHASIWALEQFGPTTDAYHYWRREMAPQMLAEHSPHHHVDAITTPMLVIHGDKDYRVPIGDGLRLWAELAERHQTADGDMPHRFLLFPDENHWILKPQHARIWYQTVFAFLEWHVRGGEWTPPDLLT